MEIKDNYKFEDVDKFEEEISRIIYMWRRYEGTRCEEGKIYSKIELDDLKLRIIAYLDNHHKFNFDEGIVVFK